MLSGVQWIMGELHGVRDFELLAYLSRGFDLKVQKKMDSDPLLSHKVQNKKAWSHLCLVKYVCTSTY